MEITQITVLEDVELNNPVFIEALPGIGHVGKLAADHMIDEFNATKFAEIYSPSFPPQVFVGEEGLIENMINELYYVKNVGEDNLDIIILVGNTQALSPEGQYGVCQDILNFVKGKGASKIFTLGGMATGQPVEESKIFGAATDEENIELLKEAEVEIRSNDGGIVGASGLFLGLGLRQEMNGICLMGQTPGYFIDAQSAEAILNKLAVLLNFEIDTVNWKKELKKLKKCWLKLNKWNKTSLTKLMLAVVMI